MPKVSVFQCKKHKKEQYDANDPRIAGQGGRDRDGMFTSCPLCKGENPGSGGFPMQVIQVDVAATPIPGA